MSNVDAVINAILYYCGLDNRPNLNDAELKVRKTMCRNELAPIIKSVRAESAAGKTFVEIFNEPKHKVIAEMIAVRIKRLDDSTRAELSANPDTRSHIIDLLEAVKAIDPSLYEQYTSNQEDLLHSDLQTEEQINALNRQLERSGALKIIDSSSTAPSSSSRPTDASGCYTDCPKEEEISKISFESIAGQHTSKNQLRVNYIYPFVSPGLFPEKTKGILLYGPPGTGKTLLAKAATYEIAGAAFYAPSPGDLRGKYEGETEKAIKNIFECAQNKVTCSASKTKCAVIFLDEADSIMGVRSSESATRSTNALLQAIDGLRTYNDVSVMAATNYPWNIDPAALRRFSAKIFIDKPDAEAMRWIIRDGISKAFKPIPMSDRAIADIIQTVTRGQKSKADELLKRYNIKGSQSLEEILSVGRRYDTLSVDDKHRYSMEFLDLMLHFDGGRCFEEGRAEFSGKITTIKKREVNVGDVHVTDPLIFNIIIKKMYHNDDVELIIDTLKEGRDIITPQMAKNNIPGGADIPVPTLSEIQSNPSKYKPGYTASDVEKIVQNAKRKSSLRAMSGFFRSLQQGSHTLVSCSHLNAEGEKLWYITEYISPKTMADARKFIGDRYREKNKNATAEEVNVHTMAMMAGVSIRRNQDIISNFVSFHLCEEDFYEAIEEYPSSINIVDYVNLLRYNYLGVVPDERN